MKPRLLSLQKIWSKDKHNALTDLIHYKGHWYCTFREADAHMKGENGVVRIIKSAEGKKWRTAALMEKKGLDLRDPKFSVTPNGDLMLLVEGTKYTPIRKTYSYRQAFVSFSSNAQDFSPLKKCLGKHEWPWRVTWFEGVAYTASYRYTDPKNPRAPWEVSLFGSADGVHFKQITKWKISDYPSEVTLRFRKNGTMLALVRRGVRGVHEWKAYNWIGTSAPPYTKWKWHTTNCHLGGPNFLILPSRKMWATGRILYPTAYGVMEKMALATMTETTLKPVMLFPSAGDSSYPGMVFHKNVLWMSYYASHEGKAAIYLARIKLPK